MQSCIALCLDGAESELQHREAVHACATQLREPSLKGRYTFASSPEDAGSAC